MSIFSSFHTNPNEPVWSPGDRYQYRRYDLPTADRRALAPAALPDGGPDVSAPPLRAASLSDGSADVSAAAVGPSQLPDRCADVPATGIGSHDLPDGGADVPGNR